MLSLVNMLWEYDPTLGGDAELRVGGAYLVHWNHTGAVTRIQNIYLFDLRVPMFAHIGDGHWSSPAARMHPTLRLPCQAALDYEGRAVHYLMAFDGPDSLCVSDCGPLGLDGWYELDVREGAFGDGPRMYMALCADGEFRTAFRYKDGEPPLLYDRHGAFWGTGDGYGIASVGQPMARRADGSVLDACYRKDGSRVRFAFREPRCGFDAMHFEVMYPSVGDMWGEWGPC